MKKILIFSLFFGILIISAYSALALEIPNPLGEGTTILGLIGKIATWLLEIGMVISTIIVLWAAIVFMTSGGNQTRVTMARKTLWYAIIGLAILLLATGVSKLIENILSGKF